MILLTTSLVYIVLEVLQAFPTLHSSGVNVDVLISFPNLASLILANNKGKIIHVNAIYSHVNCLLKFCHGFFLCPDRYVMS